MRRELHPCIARFLRVPDIPNHPVTPKGQKYALYLVENIDTC